MDLSHLNDEQRRAVTHKTGPLMIIAGAGTGKTNVITHRIAWLIEQGLAKPSEIVALTFTEKAAGEMGERLERLIGHRAIEVGTATFHGFAQQLIFRHGLEIGVTPGAPLLSEIELWLLMNREFHRFDFLRYYKPHGNPTKFLRTIIKHIQRLKDENISVEAYRAYAETLRSRSDSGDESSVEDADRAYELSESYAMYQSILLERGVMDFGDLMFYANKIVTDRLSVRARLQTRYKYIVVDEFQDTNVAQYDLVRALLSHEQNITVVGDDDQAIYKFRGASVENILTFRDDFPSRVEVYLKDNYRSHQEILDSAYTLIQHNNPHRLEGSTGLKELRASKGSGGRVEAYQFKSGIAEARWIADEIQIRIEKGFAPQSIAVLSRASSQLEETANELRRRGVPYVIAQTDGLLRTRVAIDMMALLRVALERHNSNAWYQLAISRIASIEGADVVEAVAYARRKDIPLSKVLIGGLADSVSAEGQEAIARLVEKTTIDATFLRENLASSILYKLLEQSGYFSALVREIDGGSVVAMTDMTLVNQFLEFVAEWEARHRNATPHEFLDDCARLLEAGEEGQQALDTSVVQAVQLLTVHASKGLEFDTVFVISMIEGRFPGTERSDAIEIPAELLKKPIDTEDQHTLEERRLGYVAFTRAKQELFMTCAERYSSAENARTRKPSRFITEASVQVLPGSVIDVQDTMREVTDHTPFVISAPQKTSFSFTQLQSFEKCPYQYWFAHVLKLPTRAKWNMNFGRSLHGALQSWYELLRERSGAEQVSLFDVGPREDRSEIPDVSVLIEQLGRSWISEGYPSRAFEEKKRDEAVEILREYYRSHKDKWVVPTFIEQRFKIVVGGEIITGSIDRMDVLPDGTVEIVDYKTGTPKTSEDLSFTDKEQLLIYQMAAERQFNTKPTLLSYYYLQNNEKASFVAKEKDLEKIETFVGETVAEIKTSNFPPKPSQFVCSGCDFKDICPYRQL